MKDQPDTVPSGPYRATKLWNDVIKCFRDGMPRGRHWRRWKNFNNCFVASNAVNWLHDWLINNPNFGQSVSRQQAVQLLQKLHKAGIIADVRGTKHNGTQFGDNYRLFMFTPSSPKKNSPKVESNTTNTAMRAPLSTVVQKNYPITSTDRVQKADTLMKKPPKAPVKDKLLTTSTAVTQEFFLTETHAVYKNVTLGKLMQALGVDELTDILDSDTVSGAHIHHNLTHVNRNGIVTNVEKKDQLPHWVVAAMRCLARWPEKSDDDMPDYPGFERDVFKVVQDHFLSQNEPIIPFSLYECFTNVMAIMADDGDFDEETDDPFLEPCPPVNPQATNLKHYQSAENLILDITATCHGTCESSKPREVLVVHDPVPQGHTEVSSNYNSISRQNSVPELPGLRLETWFGLDNEEPETVISQSTGSVSSPHSHDNSLTTDPKNSYARFSSLSNVNDVNIPENMLGQHVFKRQGSLDTAARMRGNTISYCNRTNYSSSLPVAPPRTSNGKLSSEKPPPPPYVSPPSYHTACSSEVGIGRKSWTSSSGLQCSGKVSDVERMVSSTSSLLTLNKARGQLASEGSLRPVSTIHGRSRSYTMDLHDMGSTGSLNTRRRRTRHLSTSSATSVSSLSLSGETVNRALQLCSLFLSPADRRKLSLLLRFMNKVTANPSLVLNDHTATPDLVVNMFTRCILRCREEVDYDEITARFNVNYLMMNYADILSVPNDLKVLVERQVTRQQYPRAKFSGSWGSADDKVYCERVSVQEYEQQKMSASQEALHQLLISIANDRDMSGAVKQKHLKQFQLNYPEIYSQYFPQTDAGTSKSKPIIKEPLFSKPLQKLRNLRL